MNTCSEVGAERGRMRPVESVSFANEKGSSSSDSAVIEDDMESAGVPGGVELWFLLAWASAFDNADRYDAAEEGIPGASIEPWLFFLPNMPDVFSDMWGEGILVSDDTRNELEMTSKSKIALTQTRLLAVITH